MSVCRCADRRHAGGVGVGVRAGDAGGDDAALADARGQALAAAVRHRKVLTPAQLQGMPSLHRTTLLFTKDLQQGNTQ